MFTQIDESVILHLTEMGFPIEACKKAVFFTGNQGLEAATSWVMEHMNDSGIAIFIFIWFFFKRILVFLKGMGLLF